MNSRSSVFSSVLLALDLPLQGTAEQRQRAMPPDPPQPRFDVQERRGHPAVLLVGGPPGGDLPRAALHEGVDGLQAVRGLQAGPEGPEDAQAVEGERLLEALVRARDGRLVQEPEFTAQPQQGALRLGVARLLVGRLSPWWPGLGPTDAPRHRGRAPNGSGQFRHPAAVTPPATPGPSRGPRDHVCPASRRPGSSHRLPPHRPNDHAPDAPSADATCAATPTPFAPQPQQPLDGQGARPVLLVRDMPHRAKPQRERQSAARKDRSDHHRALWRRQRAHSHSPRPIRHASAPPHRGHLNPSGHRSCSRYNRHAFSVANCFSNSTKVRGYASIPAHTTSWGWLSQMDSPI
jgi:hypothetical protein